MHCMLRLVGNKHIIRLLDSGLAIVSNNEWQTMIVTKHFRTATNHPPHCCRYNFSPVLSSLWTVSSY